MRRRESVRRTPDVGQLAGAKSATLVAIAPAGVEPRPLDARLLLDRCDVLSLAEPARAARLAWRVLRFADGRETPALRRAALMRVASALARSGQPKAGEVAALAAGMLLREATLAELADVRRRWALVDVALGRPERALEHLARASDLLVDLGQRRLEVDVLVMTGLARLATGDRETAGDELLLATRQIPRDTALEYTRLHLAVSGLAEAAGASSRVKAELEPLVDDLNSFGKRILRADDAIAQRRRWLTAWIAGSALGRPEAETELRACLQWYVSRRRTAEAVGVSADLIELERRQGRDSETAALIGALFPLLGRPRRGPLAAAWSASLSVARGQPVALEALVAAWRKKILWR